MQSSGALLAKQFWKLRNTLRSAYKRAANSDTRSCFLSQTGTALGIMCLIWWCTHVRLDSHVLISRCCVYILLPWCIGANKYVWRAARTVNVRIFNYTEYEIELHTFFLRAPPTIHIRLANKCRKTYSSHRTPTELKIDFQKYFRQISGRYESRETSWPKRPFFWSWHRDVLSEPAFQVSLDIGNERTTAD